GTTVAGVTQISMPPQAAAVNFSPTNVTVILGMNSTILWTNNDEVQHTVVVCAQGAAIVSNSCTPIAHSSVLSKGDTYNVILNQTGTFRFYCSIHPTTMRGVISVVGGASITIPAGTANDQLNYLPATFSVVIGVNNTVTFVNQDSTTHTVTADNGA